VAEMATKISELFTKSFSSCLIGEVDGIRITPVLLVDLTIYYPNVACDRTGKHKKIKT
jgi:hypothetical protein